MIVESFVAFMQKIMLFSGFINANSSFPKPLTVKQEMEYLEKYRAGDMSAKDILINHNLRLVAHIVKKYSGTEEADDLISVGSLGLIKAINTFQPGFGTQLSTYAARCIENEILMLLRVNKKHKGTISTEESLGVDAENNEISLLDIVYDEDDNVENNVENTILSSKLDNLLRKHLSTREYEIICLRYGLNNLPMLTQREVAAKLDISRSYISRLEKKAIHILRDVISKENI